VRRELLLPASAKTSRRSRIVRVRRNEGAAKIQLSLAVVAGRGLVSASVTPEEAREIAALLVEAADGAEAVLRERAEDVR
jgi:hypothetical protein